LGEAPFVPYFFAIFMMPQQPLSGRALCLALGILLCVTWVPILGIHLSRTLLDNEAGGTVLVIFPPALDADQVLQNVLAADGSLIQPLVWPGNAWLVHSASAGFVQRLAEQGAWVSFSPELLNPAAIFACFNG
jgi:hypothetical protein